MFEMLIGYPPFCSETPQGTRLPNEFHATVIYIKNVIYIKTVIYIKNGYFWRPQPVKISM